MESNAAQLAIVNKRATKSKNLDTNIGKYPPTVANVSRTGIPNASNTPPTTHTKNSTHTIFPAIDRARTDRPRIFITRLPPPMKISSSINTAPVGVIIHDMNTDNVSPAVPFAVSVNC